MSKFFNEVQKVRSAPAHTTETDAVDVISVIGEIKQNGVVEGTVADEVLGEGLGIPRLGLQLENELAAITVHKDRNYVSPPAMEGYRSLRTRVMRLQSAKGVRSIMLTSSVPGEGKTVTSLNLATCYAQLEDPRVLLIDADLRSRGLTRLLDASGKKGLADVLNSASSVEHTVLATDYENFRFLGAGLAASNPAELFAGAQWNDLMKWAGNAFDIVLVDAPPIHSLADAELIGTACDATLVVIRAGSTPREMVQKCVQRLDKKKVVGIVFNGTLEGPESRYSYFRPETQARKA